MVLIASLFLLVLQSSAIIFNFKSSFAGVSQFFVKFVVHNLEVVFLLLEGVVQALVLVGHDLELGFENEVFTPDSKLFLIKLLESAIEIPTHLGVLGFKQVNMLVTCFFIVKELTDSRVLVVLSDLFFQNSELQVHEVNLLLEVLDVLVSIVLFRVWIGTDSAVTGFILSSKVHDSR